MTGPALVQHTESVVTSDDTSAGTGGPAGAEPTRAWDARAIQLSRMARASLIVIIREHAASHVRWWAPGCGPEAWSKDELVADILRIEFPEIRR
jgi:hypothetical protein